MRQYSIIVPAMSNLVEFEKTLASVLRYSPTGSEVVVPCAHDFRDVHGLDGEVKLVRADAKSKPELPQLFRLALEHAGKELVGLFLPGVEPAGEWHSLVSTQFDDPEIAAISPTLVPGSESTVRLPNRAGVNGIRMDRQFGRKIAKTSSRNKESVIDGPLVLAAVFRNELFGWLDMNLTGLSPESLEIELAAGIKNLDYRSINISDWLVPCDSAVLENWKKSHIDGADQERIIRRHASNGTGGMSLRILFDLLRGRAGSAFGRLLARRHGRKDEQFNQNLTQRKLNREKLGLAISNRQGESSPKKSARRAA